MPSGRSVTAATAALALALALSACTAGSPSPTSSATAIPETTGSAQPSPTATEPAQPAFIADATAAENLPVFTAVVGAVWATPSQVTGRAYIDALVAAGFDRNAMELTPDVSTVGNPAESIQFSVRLTDNCLLGQVGPATGDPVTIVAPILAEGRCLIGETVPVDG